MNLTAQCVLTRDEMESRRFEAAKDLLNGLPQSYVARKFGVSRTTASRWCRALNGRGVESLRKRRAPGRPSRLKPHEFAQISELFELGPEAFGIPGRWTTARLAKAIESRFGVRYDPDHVGRILHRLGLQTRASRRHPQPAPAYDLPVYADAVQPTA